MADKPTLNDFAGSARLDVTKLNANNTTIEDAIENGLGRGGTGESNNSMAGVLDMDLNKIQNLGLPVAEKDAVRLIDLSDSDATGAASAELRLDLISESNGYGVDLIGNATRRVDTYTELKALTSHDNNDLIILGGRSSVGDGGDGVFYWDSSDLSTEVTADTQSGIYVAPSSDTTGASGSWVRQYRGAVDVKWFGAVGDGVANDTVSINAALASTYNNLQQVYATAGTYLYEGGGLLGNGNILFGDGRNATILKSALATPTGGYLIKALGYGSGVRSINFSANVSQTGGSYVVLAGPESFIDDFFMDGDFNGILMVGSVSRIRHGRFQDGASGATRIRAEGGDNSQMIDDVLMGAQSPQISFAGIRVRNSSALMISNTSVIQQGHALLIDPDTETGSSNTADGSVFSLYVNNCFFDNSSGNGIRISPTGTGSVIRCRFSDVWASSSSSDGVLINNVGSGTVSGIHFESLHSVLNTSSGVSVTGTVTDLRFDGGEFCQNAFGLYINSGTTNLTITNATVGTGAGLLGNTNNGIVISSGCDHYMITDNYLAGNGASLSLVATANRVVKNNIGVLSQPDTTTGNSFIANGNTSVVVAHNLGVDPGSTGVIIWPNTGHGSNPVYVDTSAMTTTTFTVRCASAASGDLYFGWRAFINNL